MNIREGRLEGVRIIEPIVFEDECGYFMESCIAEKFAQHGITTVFVQDNHSLSIKSGVIKGMHYQEGPKAQMKLVRVSAGAIYDVLIDIRRDSSTNGQWEAFELSADTKLQLLIPAGFAHGFCTLAPNTEVQPLAHAYDNFVNEERRPT